VTNFVLGFIIGWMVWSDAGRDVAAIIWRHATSAQGQIEYRMKNVELPPATKP
jgi:hypothetical protein